MGLLDFLKRKKPKEEAAVELKPRVVATRVSLNDLQEKLVERRKQLLEKVVPHCKPVVNEIKADLKALNHLIKDFSEREVKAGIDGYKIATQMKENFLKRVPPLIESLAFPEQHSFDSIQEFSDAFNRFVTTLSKTVFDNRYLFLFFRKDFEKIGRVIKSLESRAKNLTEEVYGKKDAASEYKDAIAKIMDLEKTRKELKTLQEQEKVLSASLSEKEEKRKGLQQKKLVLKTKKVEEQLHSIEQKLNNVRQELATVFSPLERSLRKLQKTCLDKRLSKTIADYLRDPIEALKQEGAEFPEFKKVCSDLKKALEKGELERTEKAREKISVVLEDVFGGKPGSLLRKLLELENAHEKKKAELAPLMEVEQSLSTEGTKISEGQKILQKTGFKKNELQQKLLKQKQWLEERIQELLEERFSISD